MHSRFLPRPAVRAWKQLMKNQGTALVIGSNVGSEAFYFSLWLRVRTIGVEILCDLNSIAENLRKEFEIPKHALEFVCEDALSESTSHKFQDAGIVWLDDQTFDLDLVVSLGSRLSQHVSPESTIITYRSDVLLNMVKIDGTPCFEQVGIPSHVVTTWSTSEDGLVNVNFLRVIDGGGSACF